MSLAPPPPPPRLSALRREDVLFAAGQFRTVSRCATPGRFLISSVGRACCLFSGGGSRKKQDEARRAPESPLWQKKTEFEKWGLEIERRQQRGRRGGPAAGGGGWSGGGGWFRWFSGGGFWNSAKQTVLTILGIVAAFFLIANFNVLVAAVVNSLLAVLRQIRRVLSFVAHCVSQGISVSASGPKSTSVDSGNLAAVPVKVRAGMSAKERVVRKWGMD